MAGRLSGMGSRIMGGNGVVGRSLASSLRTRSGMGLPVGKHMVPDKPVSLPPSIAPINFFSFSSLLLQIVRGGITVNHYMIIFFFWAFLSFIFLIQLPVHDELVWDNGTPYPEPCVDRLAPTIGKV